MIQTLSSEYITDKAVFKDLIYFPTSNLMEEIGPNPEILGAST